MEDLRRYEMVGNVQHIEICGVIEDKVSRNMLEILEDVGGNTR